MQRVRRPVLAGICVAAVLLSAGCSDPAPVDVPTPAVTPAVPASSATPTTPGAAIPTGTPAGAPSASAAPPQPTSGASSGVEPNRPVQTAPPKKLDESTSTAGAQVSLVSVRATTVKATGPGDRSGPGVLVRLKMVNSTKKTLDTSFTQVSLTGAAGKTGTPIDGPPTAPLDESLRAGRSGEGTYAFLLDGARSSAVTVSVYVTSGQPVVTFRGRIS